MRRYRRPLTLSVDVANSNADLLAVQEPDPNVRHMIQRQEGVLLRKLERGRAIALTYIGRIAQSPRGRYPL